MTKGIFKLKTFWLILPLTIAVIFLALINFNRGYESQIDIVVIAKNSASAKSLDKIVENLKIVARKETGVNVERINKSGILRISAFDKNQNEVKNISLDATHELIASVGYFYDIKNEIDIRIIDGPLTKERTEESRVILFLESLLMGFILVSLSFVASFYLFAEKSEFISAIYKSRWAGMISGWGIWSASSVYYDRVAYPAIMLALGDLRGGIIAGLGAMVICVAFLLHYEKTGSQWIASTEDVIGQIIKRIRKIESYNIILKIIFFIPRIFMQLSLSSVAKRGVLGFIVLSCMSDPFVTLSFFKKNRNGLTKKDWMIFMLSGLIANVYWILYTSVILVFVRAIWKVLVGII